MSNVGIAARDFDTDTIAPEFRENAYLAEIDHTLATVFLTKPIHARLQARFIGSMPYYRAGGIRASIREYVGTDRARPA